MKVKVLSVRQPWASLIVSGHKDIENRNWRTNYRGRLYIHASQGFRKSNIENHNDFAKRFDLKNYCFGFIIGYVDLIDCIESRPAFNPWADVDSKFYWLLKDAKTIKPIEAKGKLQIWEYKL